MSIRARTRPLFPVVLLVAGLFAAVPGSAAPRAQAPPSPAAAPQSALAGCAAGQSGRVRLAVSYAGKRYAVLGHLPRGHRRGAPLVVNLHGSTHDGANQQQLSGIAPVADRHRFVVLAPNGGVRAAPGYAWNVPGVPLADGRPVPAGARDDVGFLAATIRAARQRLCVDPGRVYLTGHSGGARMASTFACRRADVVAAVAAVSGLRAGRVDPADRSRPKRGDCAPSRPVAVLSFHGSADELNPYRGGAGQRWGYSVPAAVRTWSRLNQCLPLPLTYPVSRHGTLRQTLLCSGGVRVGSYVLRGAGHVWPGSPLPPGRGENTALVNEIDATSTMWSFFRRYRIR